jgi:uncharacterized membrane protein HdeD (DUF308 family)
VEQDFAIVFIISLIVLVGGVLMVAAMMSRRKMREMTHRERLAMIERGLIPSPESDPVRFEAAIRSTPRPESTAGIRYRTAGVLMIGLGIGITVLIAFTTGQVEIAVGVGGAWTVLGVASLLNYFLISRHAPAEMPTRWAPPPSRSPEPPA